MIWLREVASGRFGTSITFRQDVMLLVSERLPATLELGLVAMLLACVLGGAAGVLSAAYHGRWSSSLIDSLAAIVQSIPDFLWGLMFILLFGVLLPWLPISGRLDPSLSQSAGTGFVLAANLLQGQWEIVGSILSHMVAPALARISARMSS